jgi:cell division septal protein FtsQ
MVDRIRSNQGWKKHLPQKPRRVQRGYYTDRKDNQHKTVVRIIWVIFIIFALQSIFHIKYFKVDKINLSGNKDVSLEDVQLSLQDELTVNRFWLFQNDNYWLIKTEPMEELLLANYNLDEVQVTKKFPDILDVSIKEKISHFIWQKDDTLYLLDAKGALNRQIQVLDDKYLIIQDFRTQSPEGDTAFDADEMNIINKLYLAWHDVVADRAKLVKIRLDDNWGLLELHTDIGFYVKLDANEDLKEQINNLQQVLTVGNITGVDVDYIDIRFGDKVYFK